MVVGDLAQDKLEQIILPGLSEDHAVHGQRPPERGHPVCVPRQRENRRVALNAGVTLREHPVRDESAVAGKLIVGELVGRIPRVEGFATRGRRPSMIQCLGPHHLGDVLPDGVAVIAVDPPFTLFEIDGVRGEVPVHDGVAIPVKVEALLPDGGGAEHERPEGGIERSPNNVQMLTRLLVRAAETVVGVAAREVLAHGERLTPDPCGAALPFGNIQTHGCQPESLAEGIHETAGTRLSAEGFADDVEELVEHIGEPSLKGVGQHSPPVLPLACVGGSRWHIETEFETEKSDVGLDEYETRTWAGWHHHIAMCLLAGAILLPLPAGLGGKMPLVTRPQVYRVVCELLPRERFGPKELLLWLEGVQRRNERARRSHEKRRAAVRANSSIPP